jgi:hypothetical protein
MRSRPTNTGYMGLPGIISPRIIFAIGCTKRESGKLVKDCTPEEKKEKNKISAPKLNPRNDTRK